MNAPLPPDENQRLQEVQRYAILDTPPEAAFERLTRLAARLFKVPIAIIKLIDEERQWFQSCFGLEMRETPREVALCAHAILTNEVLVVPDTRQDARFAQSPIVTGAAGVRFYAGAPLQSPDGLNIGTFAIMDRVPRDLSEEEIASLSDLAALAVDEMELRLAATALRHEAGQERERATFDLRRSEELFRSLIENASDITAVLDRDGTIHYQSPSIERVLGYGPGQLIGKNALDLIHRKDAGVVQEALRRGFENPGVTQTAEYRLRHQDGSWRVLESVGKILPDDSAERAAITSRDITERKRNEEALQAAKDQLQVVLDTIPGGVTWVSSDGRYLGANRYLAQVFKVPAENFIGQPIGFMGVSPGFDELVRGFFDGAAQQASFEVGLDVNGEARIMLIAAGKYQEGRAAVFVGIDITARQQAEAALQRAHDELEARVRRRTGELDDVIEALRDEIAERKRVEASLRESEAQFKTLAEAIPQQVWTAQPDGALDYVNQRVLEYFGRTSDDMIGWNWMDVVHPDDVSEALARSLHSLQTGEPYEVEFRLKRADGAYRWNLGRAVPLRDDEGRIVQWFGTNTDIAERKQAEAALRESEERFRLLVEGTKDYVMFLMDAERNVVHWNAGAERVIGYDKLEVLGQSGDLIFTPEDRAAGAPEQEARQAIEDGRVDDRRWHLRKDGTLFWAEGVMTALHNADGQLHGFAKIMRDATAEKQTEQALRESEAQFKTLIEAIPQQVWTAWPDGAPNYLNRRVREQFGCTFEQMLEGNWVQMIHPGDVARTVARWTHALKTGAVYETEFRLKTSADGAYRWNLSRALPLRDDEGRIVQWFGTNTDIDERKEAEAALRQSEARKGAILETALDCIITIDHQGKVLDWNPAAEKTFGYSRQEAVGQLMAELIVPAAMREQHIQGVAHYQAGRESAVLGKRLELPAVRADGSEIVVEVSTNAIPTDGPPLFTSHVRDITERKQSEEALKAATAEAERANAAKSEFLSRMSHELRTPMNSILGFGQLLEMDELNVEQTQGVQQILKAGRHLLELINEVLDIARIESEQMPVEIETVPVVETLMGALELVRPLAAARGIELRDDCGTDAGLFVLADRRRLKQVLLNLLANAVKYNRDGGAATLSCAATAAGRLRIAISDTGPGLAPEQISRLFTPFERLGAEQSGIEGTGLGLALSKRLVEAMGGEISVQSVVGEGSTFAVELPLAQEQTALSQASHDSPATAARQPVEAGETQAVVLYIEDNPANFGLVQNILRHRSEIKLLAAMRGSAGLALAQRHRPDLILLDFHLPDMSGDEVLLRLRAEARTRDIPVIVVSADATPHRIEQMQAAGVVEYLTKPLDVKQFLTVLDKNLKP